MVLVNHPDLIEQVLVADNKRYIKHYVLRLLTPILGNGLVTSDGPLWLRQRRMIQPAFARQRIEAYGQVMVEHTLRMLDGWRPGESRDVAVDMMHLALGIVSRTLLDVDAGAQYSEVAEAIDTILEDFDRRFQSALPPPFWLPAPGNRRLRRAVAKLDAILGRIIRQRREQREDRGDLLSSLVEARDAEDQTGMTDRQLRDEVMTIFLAGHETTANALSWTWYLLATHPEVEARLLAELRQVLAGRAPTPADVPRLPFTEQVLKESMRLYPPAYTFGREATTEVELAGYRFPAGTTVLVSPYTTQRDARFFERPDDFDPDRWSPERAPQIPRYAYFPFGGGPRGCIGNTFAMLEATLVLATVVPRFHLSLLPDPPVVPRASVTLRPKDGVHCRIEPRIG